MDAEHIFAVCWGVSFFILGIVVLLGIADELMAGYNTASEEERKKIQYCVFTNKYDDHLLGDRGACSCDCILGQKL